MYPIGFRQNGTQELHTEKPNHTKSNNNNTEPISKTRATYSYHRQGLCESIKNLCKNMAYKCILKATEFKKKTSL